MDYGHIDLKKIVDTPLRIKKMAESIFSLIEKYSPDSVTVESVHHEGNLHSTILLSELAGMICGYCYGRGIKVGQLQASAWRSALNYKQGRSEERESLKQQSIDNVKKWFGFIATEDEAEAICINLASQKINQN